MQPRYDRHGKPVKWYKLHQNPHVEQTPQRVASNLFVLLVFLALCAAVSLLA